MIDITAGLATQIRNLERRLKEIDTAKENPTKVKEITDVIKDLKEMLKEKMDKKEQRKKIKEEKAKASTPPAPTPAPAEEVKVESNAVTDKVEADPKVAPHVIVPDSLKKHDEIVKKVENDPKIAPHIISDQEPKADLHKFSIDDKVEPIRGEPGSWGQVMREADVNGDPLVYVKWMEGPIKDKHGEYGGYYQNDLKKKEEAKAPEAVDMTAATDMKADLENNYRSMLEDLKVEKQNATDQGNHFWAGKLDKKILDLEAKIEEKFGDGRENGSGGTERLTVVDQTPSSSNDITDDQAGKDSNDEYQDMWANGDVRDLESAKGPATSLFDVKTAPHVVDQLKSFINAPFVNAYPSALGGDQNVSILLTISADPQEKWPNGILQNSRYGNFHIYNDGTVEQFSGAFAGWKQPNRAFRKSRVNSVEQLVGVLNAFLAKLNTAPAASTEPQPTAPASPLTPLKTSGLVTKRYALYVGGRLAIRTLTRAKAMDICKEKFPKDFAAKNFEIKEEEHKSAFLALTVYKQAWKAVQVKKEGKSGYDVVDNNDNKVMHIALKDSQELSKEQLEHIVATELEKGFKQAFLREDVANLKKGTKVFILASDKKKVKVASLEQNIRGWLPTSKLTLIALDAQMVQHEDHQDKVLGQSGSETLLDCANGPVWVSSETLLNENRPPATPESLNMEEGLACPRCESTETGSDFKTEGKHFCKRCGNEWGEEEKKEALKTQLPTKIFPQRGDVMEGSLKTAEEGFHASVGGVFKKHDDHEDAKQGTDKRDGATMWECPRNSGKMRWEGIPEEKTAEQSDWSNDATLGEYVFLNSDVSLRNVVEEFAKRASSKEQLAKMMQDNFGQDTDPSVDWVQLAGKFVGMSIEDVPVMDVSKKRDELLDKLNDPALAHKHEDIKKELQRLKSSLKVLAHIREEDGKWVVWNHDYKKKLGTYPSKAAAEKRLRQIEYFKNASYRPFSKRAEVLANPYQSLTDHVNDMKVRMEQVQQRMQSTPTTKVAGEEDNSEMDLPALFEDLSMGINLLETKLGGDDIEPEMHSNVENLENLLWKLEESCGITPKLSEHEKEEPEHKEIVEDLDKEAATPGDVSLTVTDQTVADPNAPTPATPAATPATSDDQAPNCQICGGLTFGDYASYQNHMEYTHASDIMPTTPDQRRKDPVAASLKKADAIVQVVTNDPNAPTPPVPPVTPTPTDPDQPVDFDGEDIAQMPTSPLPPGQRWTWDVVTNQYIAMTDPTNPSKII